MRMGAVKRELSILQALDWAFRVECAQLDFGDDGREGQRPGISTVWVMMQRGAVGCQIDGGGRSLPHDDAQTIAGVVAALSVARGGPGMALQMAEFARAGVQPDWMRDARPRCVPRNWTSNQYGPNAKAEVFETITTRHRGRKVKRDVMWCPVTWTPSAAQIARARRHYLDWWGALIDVRADLILNQALRAIRLTAVLPPMTPWAPQDDAACELLDTGS